MVVVVAVFIVIQCQCSIIIGAVFTIFDVVCDAHTLNKHDEKNSSLIMEIN